MEGPVVLVSLCCFFAHICSRPSLLLSTIWVPRQTESEEHLRSSDFFQDKCCLAVLHYKSQHPYGRWLNFFVFVILLLYGLSILADREKVSFSLWEPKNQRIAKRKAPPTMGGACVLETKMTAPPPCLLAWGRNGILLKKLGLPDSITPCRTGCPWGCAPALCIRRPA